MDIRNLQLQVVTLRLCRPFLPLSLGKHQDSPGTAHCLCQKAFCQESPYTQKAEGFDATPKAYYKKRRSLDDFIFKLYCLYIACPFGYRLFC